MHHTILSICVLLSFFFPTFQRSHHYRSVSVNSHNDFSRIIKLMFSAPCHVSLLFFKFQLLSFFSSSFPLFSPFYYSYCRCRYYCYFVFVNNRCTRRLGGLLLFFLSFFLSFFFFFFFFFFFYLSSNRTFFFVVPQKHANSSTTHPLVVEGVCGVPTGGAGDRAQVS